MDELKNKPKREPHYAIGCPFCPDGVVCDYQICHVCGWNPAVAEKRKNQIRKEFENVH